MRRDVRFKEGGKLISGRVRMQYITPDSIVYLKTNRIYYFNGTPYYIMQGKGVIDIENLPHNEPRFNLIKLENLDYFLQKGEHKSLDYDEQSQIESFAKIANFNEIHNEPKLYTQEFKELEKRLYGIKECENLQIKIY